VEIASVHVAELNEPPAPPSLQDTVPDGVIWEPLVTDTLALKVIVLPMTTDDGFGEIDVPVVRSVMVSDDVPELVE